MISVGDHSLNGVLALLGYTKQHHGARRGGQGSTDILKGERVVFTGNAHQVWAWLRNTGQTD